VRTEDEAPKVAGICVTNICWTKSKRNRC